MRARHESGFDENSDKPEPIEDKEAIKNIIEEAIKYYYETNLFTFTIPKFSEPLYYHSNNKTETVTIKLKSYDYNDQNKNKYILHSNKYNNDIEFLIDLEKQMVQNIEKLNRLNDKNKKYWKLINHLINERIVLTRDIENINYKIIQTSVILPQYKGTYNFDIVYKNDMNESKKIQVIYNKNNQGEEYKICNDCTFNYDNITSSTEKFDIDIIKLINQGIDNIVKIEKFKEEIITFDIPIKYEVRRSGNRNYYLEMIDLNDHKKNKTYLGLSKSQTEVIQKDKNNEKHKKQIKRNTILKTNNSFAAVWDLAEPFEVEIFKHAEKKFNEIFPDDIDQHKKKYLKYKNKYISSKIKYLSYI